MKLSDSDIEKKLESGEIIITPAPDYNRINGISVDLKLGERFRVFADHTAPYIDVSGASCDVNQQIKKVMGKEIIIADDETFFLHPGELVLATTKESISIPDSLVGWLDGRSSLARLGLMVHVTAHRIDPGWSGQIVLECYNNGKLPLGLKPNMIICAINFETLSSPCLRPYNKRPNAKYHNQQGPDASKIDQEN